MKYFKQIENYFSWIKYKLLVLEHHHYLLLVSYIYITYIPSYISIFDQ